MPVLMAFYHDGDVRMEVTEEELLASWKAFFSIGTNWKDLETGITYRQFQDISDKEHLKKILTMPVRFLQKSGKGFFIKKEGAVLALREEMREVIHDPALVLHMKDVIGYRIMDYYQRRYREKKEV